MIGDERTAGSVVHITQGVERVGDVTGGLLDRGHLFEAKGK